MYLAYLDDSDTKSKTKALQVMAGVIIEDRAFTSLDCVMEIIRGELIALIPEGKLFEEFHASELYGGYGPFDGVDQEKRFEVIEKLLLCLKIANLSVVWGAVDTIALRNELFASADPLDMCFRICLTGIKSWLDGKIIGTGELDAMVVGWLQELVILVADDCDSKAKAILSKSYRNQRLGSAMSPTNQLRHFHDDMYFGDSRYSIGIQLADLCAYFIARQLEGDIEIQGFYDMLAPYVVFSGTHPNPSTSKEPDLDAEVKARSDGQKR